MSEKESRGERSIVRYLAGIPKLLGKLASLDTKVAHSIDRFGDQIDAKFDRFSQRRDDRNQTLDEKIIAAKGKLRRTRDGEPKVIPPSQEVATFNPAEHIVDEDIPPDPSDQN
jgi:hypothetical protein